MKQKMWLLLACLFMGISTITAQIHTVTGIVVAKEDGQPVVGASVKVTGTALGTITDTNGEFTLLNIPSSTKTLQVSYIGMRTQEVAMKPHLKIALEVDEHLIDEIVVVAYGTAKKSSFTGSASTLKKDKLERIQVSNLSKALEGNIAGVQTTSSTGQPGSAAALYVRGIGSILASKSPLIVVDGVPYEGSLNSLNNQDVESLTVLKDAAANSLYGARGANGVVLVTTKKGRNGKTEIQLETKWGVNSRAVSPYRTVRDEGDYYEMYWESLRNQQMYAGGMSQSDANIFASQNLVKNLGNYNSFNVADDMLINPETGLMDRSAKRLYHDDWSSDPFANGLRQEYNLSMSGGSEKTTFYASLSYLSDDSYLKNSNFERFTGRLNMEHQATKWLKTGFNVGYAQTTTNGSADSSLTSNMFAFAQFIAPIYPIWARDAQGNVMRDENGTDLFDYGNLNGKSRPYASGTSPYSSLLYDIREKKLDVLNARLFGEVTFTKGLKLTANLSIDNFATYSTTFQSPLEGDAANVGGRGTKESQRLFILNANQLLTYERSFNSHHINFLLGHETKTNNLNYLTAKKEQFYFPTNPELSNGVNLTDGDSYTSNYRLEGAFLRGEYNYADTYYFSGSFRMDGSSRFHPDNRWGSFWSVGASWRLKQEAWLQDVDFLHDLKLRASFGTQGNDNLGNETPYLDQYKVVPVNGKPGLSQTFRGNKDITWEKSENFNIGIEAGFFNRLSVGAEFFIKNTKDMLTAKPLSPSQGAPNIIYTNDMGMRNVGFELELGAQIIKTPHFSWNMDMNLTHYKNKLTKLEAGKDPSGYVTGDYWRKEGGTLFDWYLRKYAGVDPDNGDALYYMDVEDADGNITMQTTNDSNEASYYETGKSALPDLFGGLSTTFEAYGFDLNINTAFSLGGYTYDTTYSTLMSVRAGSNFATDLRNRWTPENRDTDVPRIEVGNRQSTDTSDRFLIKSSYFSLKNITLGYTFPRIWMNKLGIQSIRAFAVGDNLWLGSARTGFDPRQNIDGTVDSAIYSAIRTVSFGLNVKF